MMIICVSVCVCVSQKWRKIRFPIAPFVGKNAPPRDIITSRVRWDRERVSLPPNSKKTTQDCFSRVLFSRFRKRDDDIESRSKRCKSKHRERHRNDSPRNKKRNAFTKEDVSKRLKRLREDLTRANNTVATHSQRNNRRDSVFGGTILKANSSFLNLS